MTITYTVGTPIGNTITAGTTANVPVPSGVAPGDIVVIFGYRDVSGVDSLAILGPPSGFTQHTAIELLDWGYYGKFYVWWKRATAADTGNYVITVPYDAVNSTNVGVEAVAITFKGCIQTGSPWDVTANTIANSVSGSPNAAGVCPAVSVTTTVPDTLLLYSGFITAGWGSSAPPSGFTEIYDGYPGFNSSFGVDVLAKPTAGSSGSVSGTHTNLAGSPNTGTASWIAALKPDPPVITSTVGTTVGGAALYGPGAQSVPVPSGVAAGDIVVVFACTASNGANTTVTGPSGFTAVANTGIQMVDSTNNGYFYAWWKRATGADTGSYSVTLAANVGFEAVAISFRGCAGSGDPWDATTYSIASLGNGVMPPVSVTTTCNSAMLIYTGWVAYGWSTGTAPSGFTEVFDLSASMTIDLKNQPLAGGTGSIAGARATATGNTKTGSWLGALKIPSANRFFAMF